MSEPETASPRPSDAVHSLNPLNRPPQPIQIQPENQSQSPQSQSKNSHQSPPLTAMSPPPLTDLQNISTALSSFQNSFNSIQLHLNSLKSIIDTLIAHKNPQIPIIPPLKPNQDSPSKFIIGKVSNEEVISVEELKTCCETMNFKGLKRIIFMNLKNIDKVRLEVPKALKYARNPAKLVLECVGRFFIQGIKAYVKGSELMTKRKMSVLILECFVLMEGGEIDEDVKEEAEGAVMLWRKRMIGEGGIMRACEIDARGLLLLMAGFGVPLNFNNEELRDLMRASNIREMVGTLRNSTLLVEKVPDIIELMIKNKLEIDAIDVAYTFGLEERFNIQTILTSLLQKIKETWKKGKRSSASSAAENDANREFLAMLKSFLKCLEGHKIDSSKIITRQQIRKKIASLASDVFEYDKKSISEYDKEIRADKIKKRKAEEAEAGRRSKIREGKHSHSTFQLQQQQQNVGYHSPRSLSDAGMARHIHGYSASPTMIHTQVPRTDYMDGTLMSVDPSGHVINHGVQSYGWHTDPALTERVVTGSYAAQPSSYSLSSLYRPSSSTSSLERYVMLPSGASISVPHRGATTDLYQFTDTIVDNEYHPAVVPANHTSYQY